MKHGFVLLSDRDADAPRLPAVCTVSKYDPWPGADQGAWEIGATAAGLGSEWLDRPYWVGNPSPEWLAAKVRRNHRHGGKTQLGNEQNHPVEAWTGGPVELFALVAATCALLTHEELASVVAPPPSPGFSRWEAWVIRSARRHAVHCYGSDAQMRVIVEWFLANTGADLYVTECNPGAGNAFDRDDWAVREFLPFLNWCATKPRVRMVAYFAWRWDQSPNLPSSVDAAGTGIERILREFQPPVSPPAPEKPQEPTMRDLRGKLPTLTGNWGQLQYHDRPPEKITGVTLHYTAGPSGQTVQQIAAYQTSAAAAAQTGAIPPQPFPGIAYTLVVTEDGVPNICHDLTKRTWHSGAVVGGVARNASHVGICFTGNTRPNAKQIAGIAQAVHWCETQLDRTLVLEGHGDVLQTSCPGPSWPGWKPDVERELARLRGDGVGAPSTFTIGEGFRNWIAANADAGLPRQDEWHDGFGNAYVWLTSSSRYPKGALLIARKWLNWEIRVASWD